MSGEERERGELRVGEVHPATESAIAMIAAVSRERMASIEAGFSSCAVEGNRLAEVCSETLRRMRAGEPVGDRYVLGLAWTVRDLVERGEADVVEVDWGDVVGRRT